MNLTIDFETRSEVDISKTSPWEYAKHPSTQVFCLAVKIDDQPSRIWIAPWVCNLMYHELGSHPRDIMLEELNDLILKADRYEAHNAEFERAVWAYKMQYQFGLPDLILEKCYCSAAKGAMHSLPRKLADMGRVLNCPVQKDKEGHRLMLKMCKPRKALKADQEMYPDWSTMVFWHEKPEDLRSLIEYCLGDTDSEHEVSKMLRELPEKERQVWLMDQRINQRGVAIDRQAASSFIMMMETNAARLVSKFRQMTGLNSPGQVAKVREWLLARGCDLPNLQKETVIEYLPTIQNDPSMVEIADILNIRLQTSKSSTSKFKSLLTRVGDDERIRSTLLYHGASTGRWTGKGFQPHNLPAHGLMPHQDLCIEAVKACPDPAVMSMLFGDPAWCASSCVRGCIVAKPGHELYVVDYSSIEGRVLAWLAGETKVVEEYRADVDAYISAAADVYHKELEDITKAERQVGKTIVLFCGYGGSVGAFQTAANKFGIFLPDDEVKEIVDNWREGRPETVKLWRELEQAAIYAVANPGQITRYRTTQFQSKNGFLRMKLPSGRLLWYFQPHFKERKMPWGAMKLNLAYWGVDSQTKQWRRQFTYGGKLAENLCQSASRDLLAYAMLNQDAAGFELVMHIHDESIAEVPIGANRYQEFCDIMTEVPIWAEGMPIAVDGYVAERYRK